MYNFTSIYLSYYPSNKILLLVGADLYRITIKIAKQNVQGTEQRCLYSIDWYKRQARGILQEHINNMKLYRNLKYPLFYLMHCLGFVKQYLNYFSHSTAYHFSGFFFNMLTAYCETDLRLICINRSTHGQVVFFIGAFGVYRVIGHVCLSLCLFVCLFVHRFSMKIYTLQCPYQICTGVEAY